MRVRCSPSTRRDAETEADMVGAQIIYDTGYDPQAMVTFFQKLKGQQGGRERTELSGIASQIPEIAPKTSRVSFRGFPPNSTRGR